MERGSSAAFGLAVCLGLLVLGASWASAQTSRAASATPASVSSGRPNQFEIQRNILSLQKAQLEMQLDEAARCVANATKTTTFRDPEGNINIVPKIDTVNCARKLAQLRSQIQRLSRDANEIAQDAQFQATILQRLLQDVERKRRRAQGGQ
jgi:hypothetical protein